MFKRLFSKTELNSPDAPNPEQTANKRIAKSSTKDACQLVTASRSQRIIEQLAGVEDTTL